jgi:hypothetical protein
MTATEKLNDLFHRWRGKAGDTFVEDGIVNETLWLQVPLERRVLHLLKEPDSPSGDLRDFRELLDKAPWMRLGDWTYGLWHVQTAEDSVPPFREARDNFADACRSSAVVNLKKLAGGAYAGPGTHIIAAAKNDIEFLREEISIIQPAIVVCGGTMWMVRKITLAQFGEPLDRDGRCYCAKGVVWIDQWHPTARKRPAAMYDRVVRSYQDVLRSPTSR